MLTGDSHGCSNRDFYRWVGRVGLEPTTTGLWVRKRWLGVTRLSVVDAVTTNNLSSDAILKWPLLGEQVHGMCTIHGNSSLELTLPLALWTLCHLWVLFDGTLRASLHQWLRLWSYEIVIRNGPNISGSSQVWEHDGEIMHVSLALPFNSWFCITLKKCK